MMNQNEEHLYVHILVNQKEYFRLVYVLFDKSNQQLITVVT